MGAVDAGGEDEFGGDDAHGLFFEVRRDPADDGGMVEEALVADTDVCGEAGLGFVVFATEGWEVAGGGFGEAG